MPILVDPPIYVQRSIWKGKRWDAGIRTCAICRLQIIHRSDLTIDHWKALADGGEDAPHNWQLAHRACNMRKGSQKGMQARIDKEKRCAEEDRKRADEMRERKRQSRMTPADAEDRWEASYENFRAAARDVLGRAQ